MTIIAPIICVICLGLFCPAIIALVTELSGKGKYGAIAGVITALAIIGCFAYLIANEDGELWEKVETPVIGGDVTGVAGTDYSGTPLVRFYKGEEAYYVRITSARTESKNGVSECAQKISFTIMNKNATLKKAKSSIALWKDGKIIESGYRGEADKVISVSCDQVDYGEAEYELVASNTAGTTRKKVIIEKNYPKEACEKFDPETGSKVCQRLMGVNTEANIATDNSTQKPQEETKPAQSSGNSSSSGSSASKCLNYQSGKCWDDVEDAGYDDGYDDGWMGMRYGASFFDSLPAGFRNCTGICEDIYEDAYREGYEDGKMDANEEDDY